VAQPTVRQVHALAAALCERMGEEFPETREGASETIERLRIENGHPHPHPRLDDMPRQLRRPRRRRRGGADRLASIIARQLAEDLGLGLVQYEEGDRRVLARHADDGQRVEQLVVAEDVRDRIGPPEGVDDRPRGVREAARGEQ